MRGTITRPGLSRRVFGRSAIAVGLIHPPVGLNLYVLSTISDAPIGEVIRGILTFLIVLGIITYVPALTLWLPRLVYGN